MPGLPKDFFADVALAPLAVERAQRAPWRVDELPLGTVKKKIPFERGTLPPRRCLCKAESLVVVPDVTRATPR
jgi:hypothetical protein